MEYRIIVQYAETVLVWLGEERDGSKTALERLEALGRKLEGGITQEALGVLKLENSPPKVKECWSPINRLFSRPWWTRVCILQEVVWAGKEHSGRVWL